MKKQILLLVLMLLPMIGCALDKVNGVYQIGTTEDLKTFAEFVNTGQVYANAVLTADIDKGIDGTMIGREGFNYQGCFDGQGHTITIEMSSCDNNGTAIFHNVGENALIKDLKVQGIITTDNKYAAGIAVYNSGTIRGCYVDIDVVSSKAGDGTHGGIVSIAYQGSMIENCLAKFTIKGSTTQNCGGIVGWCDGRTNVINCLVINDGSDFDLTNNGSGTIARNDEQLQTVNMSSYRSNIYNNLPGGASTNNYATNAWGNTKCATIIKYNGLADGRICYQLNTDQSNIAWVQKIGTDPFPVPAAFGTSRVYASGATGCDGKSTKTLSFSNVGTTQATAHTYDKFGICHNCGCYNFYGLERDATDGYYLIKTPEDIDLAEGWNRITNGGQFSIKLANDVKYTANPGRYIFNTFDWFDGSFNGQGHELTIEMSNVGDNASLFPKFAGRRFENVILHGTISTSGQYAGSVAGQTYRDRVNIINTFSDITINANHAGDNTTGGFIGICETKTRLENCIYAGDINGIETTECIAGFCGWSSGQTYYTNCAFIGNLVNGLGNSKTISRNPSNIITDNVYSLNDYGYGDNDMFVLFESGLEGVKSGELAYYLNGKVQGSERFYQEIGEDLMPMPIKKEGALIYATASAYRCDGQPLGETTYSNTPPSEPVIPPHQYEEGFCTVCDGLQEDFLTPVDGWFEINNGAELVWWTNYAAKINLGASACLTADIDMDGYCDRWANVGTEGTPFYGNFDGQYHTISNLNVSHPNDNGVGFIAVMNSLPTANYGGISDSDARSSEGVYIKNLVLDKSCSILGRGYVGLVGMTAPWGGHVNIKGVIMCGNVTANGGLNASSILGCVMSSSCHVTIDNCGMTGNVYGQKENGLFSGWLGSYAEVTNCFAVGSVEGIDSEGHDFARYDGDFNVGDNIKNCYALYGTQVYVVTEEDIVSGKLAFLLNASKQGGENFYQVIGTDSIPLPIPKEGGKVFYIGNFNYANAPNPDITVFEFADAIVREVCVHNWDTNHDGVMETEEVAAVTDLGSVFRGNKQIRSFNELRNFTGLKSINNYAFRNCIGLTDINLPDGINNIGSGAFQGCHSLTSITIPNSVTRINVGTFWASGLTSIIIPEGVTSIEQDAFNDCGKLKSVTLPNTLTNIGGAAFYACSNLTSLTIGNNVTSIGGYAFYGCSGLTSITIPEGVNSIGTGAFYRCTSLISIILESNAITSVSRNENNSLKSIFGDQVKSYIIGNSVTNIGDYAFCGCNRLTSVMIGSGVLSIGNNAFYNTSPQKVIWLTNTPPSGCTNLRGNVNYVANELYTSLTNVTVYPYLSSLFEVGGVKYVPVSPSERTCDAIDCAYKESAEHIDIGETVTNRGITLTVRKINPFLCFGNTFIQDAKLHFKGNIAAQAFYGCSAMQTAELGPEITSIDASAFGRCSKLEGVVIPDAVNSLGNSTFGECSSMTFVKIGSGVNTIPTYTFSGCSALSTIQIPHSVTNIEDYVFNGCTSLNTVLMDDGETELNLGSNDNSPLFSSCQLDSVYIGRNITYPTASNKGYSPFYGNTKLRTIVISDKETEITPNEFLGCSALQTIQLGPEITSIGEKAFYGCSKLESIVIPDAVNSLGNNCFENCYSMTSVKMGNGVSAIPIYTFCGCSALTDMQIGTGVKPIDSYAFSGCSSLPTIQIPQNVTNIGDYVFNGCASLKTVLMQDGGTELNLGSNGSNPLFVSCPLDSVYIGRNITYPTDSNKGYSPFYRNTKLCSVTITDKETEISPNEFYGCTGLKNVRIGDGVTTFGDWAFSGCSSLDYFAFGSSVETIGKEAFSDCTAMTKLISRSATPPVCDTQALDDINKWECTLLVPDGSLISYQAADQWKEFFFMDLDPDGIKPIENGKLTMDNDADDWYDLNGRKLSKPQRGINIIRMSDGTTKKVLLK